MKIYWTIIAKVGNNIRIKLNSSNVSIQISPIFVKQIVVKPNITFHLFVLKYKINSNCEVKIHSPKISGEPPFPIKNKNNLKVSLSLIGFFQNKSLRLRGHLFIG